MGIVQKASEFLQRDLNSYSFMPTALTVDVGRLAVGATEKLMTVTSSVVNGIAEVAFSRLSFPKKWEGHSRELREVSHSHQESLDSNNSRTLPFRRPVRQLSQDARIEIIEALNNKLFQVTADKKCYLMDSDNEIVNAAVGEHKDKSELNIFLRAEFRDPARSLFTLSLAVFPAGAKKIPYSISELNLAVEQVSGGESRIVERNSNITGTVRFGALESGMVYRFVANDREGIPARRALAPSGLSAYKKAE